MRCGSGAKGKLLRRMDGSPFAGGTGGLAAILGLCLPRAASRIPSASARD